MTRPLLSCIAAAVLALPVLAQPAAAATAKPRKPAVHHTTRHAAHAAPRRGSDPQGSAAVDALNAQSLASARGTPAAR